MEVILIKDVPSLGKAGSIVKVSDGYARNYLIPRNLALLATDGNKKRIEEIKRSEQKRTEKLLKNAEAIKQALEGKIITIYARVGEQGKLFGSVTAADIRNALLKEGIDIDRRAIELNEPIKTTGEFQIDVRLNGSVQATVKLLVEKRE